MQAAKSLFPKVSIFYAESTDDSLAGCMVRLNSSGLHVTVAGSKSTCNYGTLKGWSRVCYCTAGEVVVDKQVLPYLLNICNTPPLPFSILELATSIRC
jgi:hypothetical protein